MSAYHAVIPTQPTLCAAAQPLQLQGDVPSGDFVNPWVQEGI